MISEPLLNLNQARRVLIIDDSIDSIKLVSTILSHHGCEADMAFDGQDAIPLLHEKSYDLIILDWHMPKMGGNETLMLLEQITPLKRRRHGPTPVLIYTASHHSEVSVTDSRQFRIVGHLQKVNSFQSTFRSIGNTLALL
jgi:CheY-like chemotaxis protein